MTLKEFRNLRPGALLTFSKDLLKPPDKIRFMIWSVGFGDFDLRPDIDAVMLVVEADRVKDGRGVEFTNNITVHFMNSDGQAGKGTIYQHDETLGQLELVKEVM